MKKIIITLISSIFLIANANAISFNIGASLTGAGFSVDGASEKNEDATKKSSDENEDAEGFYGMGSVFAEVGLTDKISVGIDLVPHALESEEVENEQEVAGSSKVTNRAEVHVNDMMTYYATLALTDNIYLKAGMVEADVLTKEVLNTGGAYPDTSIDGVTVGIGYNNNMANGMFVRVEANYSEFDSVSVTNTNDSTKSVTIDGVESMGARLSIGKSF